SELATVFALGLIVGVGGDLFNAAALVHRGRIVCFTAKEKLPTYNIFYEARTLSRGIPYMKLDADGVPLVDAVVSFEFGTVALEVCEDIWSPDGPMRRRCYSGAELVVNLSASPYRAGVVGTRREMIATRAADNQATIMYSNLVGGNDGIVYDGGGFINQNGRPVLDAPRFVEGWHATVIDLDRTVRCRREASTWRADAERFRRESDRVECITVNEPTADSRGLRYPLPAGYAPCEGTGGHVDAGEYPSFFLPALVKPGPSDRDSLLDDFFSAMALAVADYFRKTGAFSKFGVAISGGRDSCLCALVAWQAVAILHPDLDAAALAEKRRAMLRFFFMPTRYSSEGTRKAAEQLASDTDATFTALAIEEAFGREVEATETMLEADGKPVSEVTQQNVQARLRGARMWNWSNSSGAFFLQTGNMSEKAVGYTTMGGDLEGCFSVIGNLPKTVVVALLRRLQSRLGFEGIDMTLQTVAGPELAADQSGESELMPFAVLDACLYLYAGEKLTEEEVGMALTSLFPDVSPADLRGWATKFSRLFTRSIFKWVQAPLVIHLGSLDLDRERALQLPVVQETEYREDRDE
ncbi:MAG: NAD(+) synthase, partial [Polyangiaceae bacterium]